MKKLLVSFFVLVYGVTAFCGQKSKWHVEIFEKLQNGTKSKLSDFYFYGSQLSTGHTFEASTSVYPVEPHANVSDFHGHLVLNIKDVSAYSSKLSVSVFDSSGKH